MLNKTVNRIISRWKGQAYQVDQRVPAGYLLRLVLTRTLMLCRGSLSGIRHRGILFLSWRATVKARSRIRVGRTVSIERDAYIDALSAEGIVLGNNVSVGKRTRIEGTGNLQQLGKGMIVGNNVGLGQDSFYGCAGGISIGDDTIVGDFASFHSENHVFGDAAQPIRLQGVTHQGIRVGNNCWIGAKATILDGAVIEDGCIIAAGALVKAGHYPANGIYGGVPAVWLKARTHPCGTVNQENG